jgi:hypothetical protein
LSFSVADGSGGLGGKAGDGAHQVAGRDRFRQVKLEPDGQGAGAVFLAGVGGERDGRQRLGAGELAESLDQRVAVFIGHRDVAQQDVGPALVEQLERLGRRSGQPHVRAAAAEDFADQFPRVGLVVHHQHRQRRQPVGRQ